MLKIYCWQTNTVAYDLSRVYFDIDFFKTFDLEVILSVYIHSGTKIQSRTWMKLFCMLSPSEFEFGHIERIKNYVTIITTTGGLLRLEREICIPSFQQGCKYSSPLKQTAPETQGQHSVRPRKKKMTQTFPTFHRQQTHSCKGETPAGKANRKCLGKGTVYASAPLH